VSWPLRASLWLRSLFAGRDEREALGRVLRVGRQEQTQAQRLLDMPRREMQGGRRHGRPMICLGSALDSQGRAFRVELSEREVRSGGHWLITGATGSGKSYLALGILMQLIRRRPGGIVLVDMKGELAGLLRRKALPALTASMEEKNAIELLKRIAVIAPFDEQATPPFQVLARDRSVSVEVQAHEVTSSFGRTIGRDLGVLQTAVLKYTLLLAIDTGLTLVDVPKLLQDEELRQGAVVRCRLPEVKAYFAERFPRERAGSLASLLSRLDTLLMYPTLRRMLEAPGMIRFDRLIENAITIIDLGGAPAGMSELGQFFGQLLFHKLVRAIFARRVGPRTPPVTVVADEFQVLVGADLAGDFERVLTLARSQKVFLWAMFQQPAQVERLSPTLLRILRTNCNYHVLFRSSVEDARLLGDVLPIMGNIPREQPGFPDPRSPTAMLRPEEERRTLVAQVPSMPDRLFWLWNRRRQYPAILTRSATISPKAMASAAKSLDPQLRSLVSRGVLAVGEAEMREVEGSRARYRDELAGRIDESPSPVRLDVAAVPADTQEPNSETDQPAPNEDRGSPSSDHSPSNQERPSRRRTKRPAPVNLG